MSGSGLSPSAAERKAEASCSLSRAICTVDLSGTRPAAAAGAAAAAAGG